MHHACTLRYFAWGCFGLFSGFFVWQASRTVVGLTDWHYAPQTIMPYQPSPRYVS
ncbi:hypothetical protein ACVWWG_007065 [Bradyrhizobium sp. LB7.2]|jgi:hypothetical protein